MEPNGRIVGEGGTNNRISEAEIEMAKGEMVYVNQVES